MRPLHLVQGTLVAFAAVMRSRMRTVMRTLMRTLM